MFGVKKSLKKRERKKCLFLVSVSCSQAIEKRLFPNVTFFHNFFSCFLTGHLIISVSEEIDSKVVGLIILFFFLTH